MYKVKLGRRGAVGKKGKAGSSSVSVRMEQDKVQDSSVGFQCRLSHSLAESPQASQ